MDWGWDKRARESIAHGALTNSKRPGALVRGVYPTHLTKGSGSYVWDSAGNRFCDYVCGLGCNLLGYSQEEILEAIIKQARNGCTYSLGSTLEVETAEKVKEMVPFIERLRFLKTGSDACSAAVRIARCKTGRQLIMSEFYHGWHDEFVSMNPPALGVNSQPNIKGVNLESLMSKEYAAVITEPIVTDTSQERINWLHDLRALCTKTGTLLIFDEVITGFRFPKFSVSNYYNIEPDLICMGKAMANGMPLSVVGGRDNVMNCGEWFVSSTFAGETLSLAAGLKTMSLLQTRYSIERLWERGYEFIERFNSLWPGHIYIEGYPTRGVFKGELIDRALFWQEAVKAGYLFGPSWFFNFPHMDMIDTTISVCADIITKLKTGSVRLEGELPKSPFAQQMREKK